MRSGRVSRGVRQWTNFSFLVSLLCFVGWYAWQASHEKVMQVPDGYGQVAIKKSLLFWRKPTVTLRKTGKYRVDERSLEEISAGEVVCFPLDRLTLRAQGVLKTSGAVQNMKAAIGFGHKDFVRLDSTVVVDVNEGFIKRIAAEDSATFMNGAFQVAVEKATPLLKDKKEEDFGRDVSKSLCDTFGVSAVTVTSDFEYLQDAGSEVKPPTLVISEGQLIPPKILDEMPPQGYLKIALALFGTTFVYGFVRVVFAELFGVLFVVLIGLPLAALGVGVPELRQPGYYRAARRGRRTSALDGVGDAVMGSVEVAGHVADGVASMGHIPLDAGDAVEAISGLTDAGEAIGTVFDALGSLGDLF